MWEAAFLDQWKSKKSPCCVRLEDWQGGPAPALPAPVKSASASHSSLLRCHRCHGFATHHPRHRLGHHVREGRPVGGCTRPPIRVRGAGELRPRSPGRDSERGGRAPGEAASWSRHPRTTLVASRAALFREEVPLRTVQPVRPPAGLRSLPQLRLSKPLGCPREFSHLRAPILPLLGFSGGPAHGAGSLYFLPSFSVL